MPAVVEASERSGRRNEASSVPTKTCIIQPCHKQVMPLLMVFGSIPPVKRSSQRVKLPPPLPPRCCFAGSHEKDKEAYKKLYSATSISMRASADVVDTTVSSPASCRRRSCMHVAIHPNRRSTLHIAAQAPADILHYDVGAKDPFLRAKRRRCTIPPFSDVLLMCITVGGRPACYN